MLTTVGNKHITDFKTTFTYKTTQPGFLTYSYILQATYWTKPFGQSGKSLLKLQGTCASSYLCN